MNIYDQAHELARTLKQCPEYTEYTKAKELAMRNETQRALIEEYKRLQFQLQVAMASGGQADSDAMERLQRIAGVLQLSPEASAYLMAEFRFQKMLADIYKILGEAAGVDLDLLGGR